MHCTSAKYYELDLLTTEYSRFCFRLGECCCLSVERSPCWWAASTTAATSDEDSCLANLPRCGLLFLLTPQNIKAPPPSPVCVFKRWKYLGAARRLLVRTRHLSVTARRTCRDDEQPPSRRNRTWRLHRRNKGFHSSFPLTQKFD